MNAKERNVRLCKAEIHELEQAIKHGGHPEDVESWRHELAILQDKLAKLEASTTRAYFAHEVMASDNWQPVWDALLDEGFVLWPDGDGCMTNRLEAADEVKISNLCKVHGVSVTIK